MYIIYLPVLNKDSSELPTL